MGERLEISSDSKTASNTSDEIQRATNTRKLRKVGGSKQISIAQSSPQRERVLVHPINVGQGDAILLEIQSSNGHSEKHLIDGGQVQRKNNLQHYKNLKDALEHFGCIVPSGRTEAGNTLEDRICPQVKMDSIIITHPDQDHYGGINQLLEEFTIMAPIITTLASCLKVGPSGGPKVTEIGEVFSSGEKVRQHWFPLTGQGENGRRHSNIETLPNGSIVNIAKNDTFKNIKNFNFNATSILTTVSLPGSKYKYDYDVVLTGDSYGSIIDEKLGLKGKSVGVFQVPHHGSKYNLKYNLDLTKPSKPSTAKEFEDFYSSFNADIYLISHGDHQGYKHPHSEVITGILSAAVKNNRQCEIVVTATYFDETNISNWSDRVKIYHFKQDTSFVTLDPKNNNLNNEGLQLVKKVPAPRSLRKKPDGATEQTPEQSRRKTTKNKRVGRRLFKNECVKECHVCKKPITSTENWYRCNNRNCPVHTHYDCEEESRKTHTFVRNFNFKKCVYCRTCKECDKIMGTVPASCHLCGGAVHPNCVTSVPGQTRDRYTCRICREQLTTIILFVSRTAVFLANLYNLFMHFRG